MDAVTLRTRDRQTLFTDQQALKHNYYYYIDVYSFFPIFFEGSRWGRNPEAYYAYFIKLVHYETSIIQTIIHMQLFHRTRM